jgi:hypothetical protein
MDAFMEGSLAALWRWVIGRIGMAGALARDGSDCWQWRWQWCWQW